MKSVRLQDVAMPKAERQRIDRRYDFLLKLHGKNGRKALAIAEAPRIDNGYFGPDSISWKVYENVMVAGMGALSGLFISVLDPDGAYGVGHHTTYYYDTIGRIRRSLHFFAGAVAGDTASAEKVGVDLFRKHSHITGEVPATGELFQANHVETLKFTYVVGWPHLWRAYKAFGDPNATDDDERQRALDRGYDLERVLTTEDLVAGDNVFFCATGVTDGDLLNGVRYFAGGCTTQSIVMRSKSGTVRMIEAYHRLSKLNEYSAVDFTGDISAAHPLP